MKSTTHLSDLFGVAGRTAIVTGATSGLGRRFVELLLSHDANVVAVGRRKRLLDDLVEMHGSSRLLACEVDVTDDEAVAASVNQAVERFGSVEILVNNAGATNVAPAEEESPPDFRAVVDVNLNGLFSFCHYVGRHMLDGGGGSIVNVASMNGLVASGRIPEAAYCASKGAVLSLTRELAAQWARRGVRVNALAPGYFSTEMTTELFTSEAGLRWMGRAPMGRGGQPAELDGPLLFLCGNASSYMTGQAVVVDGGWTIV